MFSSWASVLMMVAPIRRPVKEPGPDIKTISVISCQVLWFSCSFLWIKSNSFSARSWPKLCLYSLLFKRKMVSGELVSRNSWMLFFLTCFVVFVVMVLFANLLFVGCEMSWRVIS